MLSLMLLAMNSRTSSPTIARSCSAFERRIAIRVSSSGGWMSAISPERNRLRSRLSSVAIEPGGRSEVRTSCLRGLVEGVEGVEELLLERLLALDELDVVDEEHVALAVPPLERAGRVVADRLDELVHERLGGDVADVEPREVLGHVVPDRLEQVGLSEAGRPDDEQRVVGPGGRLGDRERRGVGEAVRGADHEAVEGVAADRALLGGRRSLDAPRGVLGPGRPRLLRAAARRFVRGLDRVAGARRDVLASAVSGTRTSKRIGRSRARGVGDRVAEQARRNDSRVALAPSAFGTASTRSPLTIADRLDAGEPGPPGRLGDL